MANEKNINYFRIIMCYRFRIECWSGSHRSDQCGIYITTVINIWYEAIAVQVIQTHLHNLQQVT